MKSELKCNYGRPCHIKGEVFGTYLEDVTGNGFIVLNEKDKIFTKTYKDNHYSVYKLRYGGGIPLDPEDMSIWHKR